MTEGATSPDPDPTPTATPWQEYLAAAQALDAVCRQAAAETAAASRQTSAPRSELAELRTHLDGQRARLVGEVVRNGLPAPHLLPTRAEQAAAYAQVPGDPAAVAAALRYCRHLLHRADTELAATSDPALARWRVPLWLVVVLPVSAIAVVLCGLGFVLLVTG